MPDFLSIPAANLLVDEQNPRLSQPSTGQRETIRALAEYQGRKLQILAADILENGLDPSELTIVMPFAGDTQRYVVLDGNRRITALRALENPDLIAEAVPKAAANAIKRMAVEYQDSPVGDVACVVFEGRDEANHWIELRNTGERGGAGPVLWGPDETDRFRKRTGNQPNLATQALDFLENRGRITPDHRAAIATTTLTRILGSPPIRQKLGLTHSNKTLSAVGELDDVAKALEFVIREIRGGSLDVTHVYTKQQRQEFADQFPAELAVNQTTNPNNGTPLQTAPVQEITRRKSRAVPQVRPRDNLIPHDCALNVSHPRMRDIERELRRLSLNGSPNAVAVLFRVFIELSTDEYGLREKLPFTQNDPLQKKLADVADDLLKRQKITEMQARPARRAAADNSFFGPSVMLMHQWVHNQYMSPVGSELRSHWDSLQPFITAIWAP